MKKNHYFFLLSLLSFVCINTSIIAQQNGNAIDTSAAKNSTVDSTIYYRLADLEKQVAQEKTGESHFMMVGLATMGFVLNKTTTNINGVSTTTKTNSFPDADRFEISPMMLWRHGKHLLVEFEPSWDGTALGVNWGDISYFVKPGLIVRAGYLVLPFGIYNKRLAAGWINKLGSDPVGVSDYLPSSDFGVEVEGGLPLGSMKWSYNFSLTNGNQLMSDGTIQNAGLTDNNKNKTLTGRLSLLPFSNSSLELGVSGLYGGLGDVNSTYKNAKSQMCAFDLNYVKNVYGVLVNVKGQYNYTSITKENFINPNDSSIYTFSNRTNSFFSQLSLRPTKAPGILNKFELAGRYVSYTTPKNSAWGAITGEYDVAIDYWFTWRSVLKIVYESQKVDNKVPVYLGGNQNSSTLYNRFIIQYAVQF